MNTVDCVCKRDEFKKLFIDKTCEWCEGEGCLTRHVFSVASERLYDLLEQIKIRDGGGHLLGSDF